MAGGKSQSQQQQKTTQVDQRAVLGQGALYAKDGSSITVNSLDAAALARSLDTVDATVGRALDSSDASLSKAYTFGAGVLAAAAKQTDRVLDTMQATQELTANAYNDAKGRGALTDKLLLAAVGGSLVVAVVALRGNH